MILNFNNPRQEGPLNDLRVQILQLKVRVEGLEPPRLAALDPKSSVSTNSTTPAMPCSISWFHLVGTGLATFGSPGGAKTRRGSKKALQI